MATVVAILANASKGERLICRARAKPRKPEIIVMRVPRCKTSPLCNVKMSGYNYDDGGPSQDPYQGLIQIRLHWGS
jgi:hypothetical protein